MDSYYVRIFTVHAVKYTRLVCIKTITTRHISDSIIITYPCRIQQFVVLLLLYDFDINTDYNRTRRIKRCVITRFSSPRPVNSYSVVQCLNGIKHDRDSLVFGIHFISQNIFFLFIRVVHINNMCKKNL